MPGEVAKAITDGAKAVEDAITGIFDPLPGVIKKLLGIGSPSKVFADIGANVVHGFIKGIESMGPALRSKAIGVLGSVGGAVTGTAKAVGSAIAGALNATGAVTSPSTNQALGQAAAMAYGWGSGPEWDALNKLEMAEAGWNQFAKNPQSGAYGIPQALPPTKMPVLAQEGGGSDPRAQIGWMLQYIKERYGDPLNAWGGYYARGGWYAKGGVFTQPTIIGVGEKGPEAVVPLSSGIGSTHITVNLPNYLGDPKEVARVIRSELLAMKKRGTILGLA
jgi:hypothetical protein